MHNIKEIAALHNVRKGWLYEQFKKEKYKSFLKKESGITTISKDGYNLLLLDIQLLHSKRERENKDSIVENTENINTRNNTTCTEIEYLQEQNKILLERIIFLEKQNAELIALSIKNAELLGQEQQLTLKHLSNTERLLLSKREELALRSSKPQKTGILKRFFAFN